MSNKRILDKVKKLLNLAEDKGASEGEVDNAMRMAHALLVKHNLSMADIDELDKDDFLEQDVVFKNRPWVRRTVSSICKLYFCEYMVHMFDKRHRTRHTVIGRESNVVTAKCIAEFVVRNIALSAKKARKLENKDSRFERSFCEGASIRVVYRVFEILEASKQDKEPGKGLMVIDAYQAAVAENNEYMQQNHNTREIMSRSKNDQDKRGLEQGDEHGKRINLNTQLNTSKSAQLN